MTEEEGTNRKQLGLFCVLSTSHSLHLRRSIVRIGMWSACVRK